MIAGLLTPDQQKLEDRALAREIFHELSQPLTALQCGLELALYRDQSLEQLRSDVERALENADSLRERLVLIRALEDACDPGDDSQTTDFSGLMRELCDDVFPLFESAGNELQLKIGCESMVVRGDRRRLMRALTFFFAYIARYSGEALNYRCPCRSRRRRSS